ncbi:anaphase-promoting complex subunit 1 isoform X2 [Macadamia integrifolia]|uniref:anaphase-promoting complex subunit 1 isoform X2 n=1 Tax=Macadamia integrifolia TaxID=60698 RepID=UPI001C4FD357|nr:anaphase-promoting complex subunit 1 isoform X2 [Macadamia integrifolia]
MSIKVRHLTVLGEFKPFGLIAEALDGKPVETVTDKYDYFLFNPKITRESDDFSDHDSSETSSCDRSDHELFIRGNRIIWSAGSRVQKRYTLPSSVIMVCWCRLGAVSEAFLCVLQIDTLTIYNTSGEEVCIPLPHSITSIWPLPFGLLLQQSTDANCPSHVTFPSSSTVSNARDLLRPKREFGYSPQNSVNALNSFDNIVKGDVTSLSSHLILKDPLEEPQAAFVEERVKLTTMKDFDEITIWTSETIPLMASYNKGKMQHSVWLVEVSNSNLEATGTSLSDVVPCGVQQKQFSFRRIWQGKVAPSAASKVFLATDDDGVPVICFLLQEQKGLLSVRLQTVEMSNETLFDIKPDTSWSIPAISAAPVIVTHPRVKVGLLPFADIIVLASENNLVLYSGKQCLCRYSLPSGLVHGLVRHSGSESTAGSHDLRIIELADAVEGRINVIVNSGRMFRCALRRSPSSSLANDCITAMAEGLRSNFYDHFLGLLWRDGESAYLSEADACVDAEWESFSSIIKRMCQKYSRVILQKLSDPQPRSAWEFLITSKFHLTYDKCTYSTASSHATSRDLWDFDCSTAQVEDKQSSGTSFLVHFLMETLDCLHALYENLKLNNLRKRDLGLLVVLLCNIAAFLGEESYLDYYVRDFPHLADKIRSCGTAISPRAPPCLLRWLDSCLRHGCHMANIRDLPLLICKDRGSVVSWSRKIVSFYSLLLGARRLGKKLSSGVYCSVAPGSYRSPEEHTVLAMAAERFGLQQLDLLPAGVSLPFRHALDNCRESPPTDWPAAAYVLIGREDLALSCVEHLSKSKEIESRMSLNLISISTPYMLRLHPVTIPSSISDPMGLEGVKIEDADSLDGSMADGMEHIFNSSTQLRYGRDLRLNEVRRLLCSARPVAIQTSTNPSASDQDHQQAQLWQLAQRTTALPLGRGAFTLATTCTLLTEVFLVPKLNLSGRLPAQQNATVNLDPNIRNIQELRSWPEFHNAVATGLRLAPFQGKMSRTWILYNRPEEPNVTHAGLLLALGLHGHLRVLSVTDIYQYYSKEHESTTVGLMLGLAASYRGTMQPAISKSLYFHVPARHPSSFPDLEFPTLLQSAALMAVGLLYEGSAHPQTMQTLLGEIGRKSGGDNVLERECYAVSAGSAMGLVALGRGEDVLGFMRTLVDRLFQYIGGKESQNRSLTIKPSTDEQNRGAGQMMDGTSVNVDVTAPGAIIALALMFLKTELKVMASRLSIPHTHFELQYVRPDFIMLRVIARNLIMWSRVQPSGEWIQSQIPDIVKMGVLSIGDETADCDELDVEALVQAFVNIVAGACISLGLRYAGTRNGDAQELLYNYAVYFLNEIKPVSVTSGITLPKGLSQYVDRGTLEICLHLIVLSLSVVMAGSGHLQTFRLLRFLRSRNPADGHASYGIQMAVSLAIGFLFLGGGMHTFSTSNTAIASLLITLYPRLPNGPNDNRCHLQAFRHLYVLAAEARWVQTIDVDTGLPVYAPLEVTTVETENYAETSFCEISPCILPERAVLKTVRVCGPRYWPQVIELVPEDKPWWSSVDKNNPFNCGIIYIKRKVGACSYVDDPIGCQSLLSRAMHKACDLTSLRACTASIRGNDEPGSFKVDQLVSTFSTDPSLIAFAQLCCDPSWNSRSDVDFQEFCLQVLFECVTKDRPALLQVYVSLYTTLGSMAEQVTSGNDILGDSLFISSLKLALSYGDALTNGRLSTSRGSILQSIFIGSIRKRVEEILNYSQRMKDDLYDYLSSGRWPHWQSEGMINTMLLSWFLKWFEVPPHLVVKSAVEKIKPRIKTSSSIPMLQMLFPQTHINAIIEIDNLFSRVNS